MVKVYLVAGELSGDLLGAGLMRSLKARHPDIEFRGVGGPRMEAEGLSSQIPLERLAIMGLAEVVRHLPELFRFRRQLREDALAWQADIMVGIDYPDFNLRLARQLHDVGMPTVHYVSPSVWAWRQGRVKGIRASIDRMLTLLPFEASFYKAHQVPVSFVGHPLAEELPVNDDMRAAREALDIAPNARVLAVLPGSRRQEIAFNAPAFRDTVERLRERDPLLNVVVPAANATRASELDELGINTRSGFQVLDGKAWQAMTAADAVLLTSGTAALEAMLCHRPMVVAYRHSNASHWLAKRLVKTPWISLPNLIAQKALVPELIQDQATPERLAETLWPLLSDSQQQQDIQARFKTLHQELQRGASDRAAEAVLEVLDERT
ncbi:lipid-A-disaccharide synthase [Larsenimonas suaedae]|uniref:Lipid-A-disaccharide synthase n=1 Tax=Larsenimonas suaedae TaxID=1851019 RepID=A0ABU1GSU1_9GAMM|nr:lipid-A-disaccharide synthase [Larsenimonas suaedae]MCM2972309.1 lipid-A-disaccharide synthase [Larsenimonas suaedae]MDR5894895.1 lipid-A-disaccharide synthase [Larsenimonas suaedae]